MSSGRPAYSTTAKALHWLAALLVLSQLVTAALMPYIGPTTQAGTVINLHLSLGVVVLVLTAMRVANRLLDPVPLDPHDSRAWELLAAQVTHRTLYFILLVGPFLGWASASAHRFDVTLFGLVPLPPLAAPWALWALVAGDIHTLMMWILLGLVTLHASVALYHHFVRHDAVLRRMLPAAQSDPGYPMLDPSRHGQDSL
jgi:cytochrome b561